MEFTIRDANIDDYELIKSYKHHSIFDYAEGISDEEKEKIENYIENNLNVMDYKIMMNGNDIVGAYLVTKKEKILLDEIYIESKYRNQGIGSKLIKGLIEEYKTISLWVYKENKAFNLYQRLGFKVDKETDTRYHMTYYS